MTTTSDTLLEVQAIECQQDGEPFTMAFRIDCQNNGNHSDYTDWFKKGEHKTIDMTQHKYSDGTAFQEGDTVYSHVKVRAVEEDSQSGDPVTFKANGQTAIYKITGPVHHYEIHPPVILSQAD